MDLSVSSIISIWTLLNLALLISAAKSRRDKEAKVTEIMESINKDTRELGRVYAEYSSKEVSWDDGDRGTSDGELSVWGASITDTRLWAKDGTLLFTVRSDNWNEKLGYVSAEEIKLIVGNDSPGGNLKTITLKEFLKAAGTYGAYAGLPSNTNLYNETLDKKVSIRFQTTFLPVDDKDKATLEFATEAYNYNTISDTDPKNLVVLATTQGIAVQQDGEGAKKLYHHEVDSNGAIHRYWLEAERTKHKVGGSQNETKAERLDAKKRGKALAEEIGIDAMGKRFNVLMTIQIPLKQANSTTGLFGEYEEYEATDAVDLSDGLSGSQFAKSSPGRQRAQSARGEANAARVSRGSEVDTWSGLTVESPVRSPTQHITVTVVFYNTIAGGVPKLKDVVAAIDDMEALYKACHWSGHLADKEANFMKKELTNETLAGIGNKINTQPYIIKTGK